MLFLRDSLEFGVRVIKTDIFIWKSHNCLHSVTTACESGSNTSSIMSIDSLELYQVYCSSSNSSWIYSSFGLQIGVVCNAVVSVETDNGKTPSDKKLLNLSLYFGANSHLLLLITIFVFKSYILWLLLHKTIVLLSMQ